MFTLQDVAQFFPQSIVFFPCAAVASILEEMSAATHGPSTLERVLAFLSLISIAIAVIAFFAILFAGITGVPREELATGFWPAATWASYIGPVIGFVLIIALILIARKRRVREIGEDLGRK